MVKSKAPSRKSQNEVEVPIINLKEKLAQKRQAREARQKLIVLISVSLFLALLVGLPAGLAGGVKIGAAVAVVIPCFILSYAYPRQALWLFLIYMPFSGTVTYWIGQGNALFQVSKDALYIPALLGLIYQWRRTRRKQPILIPKQLWRSLGILLFFALLTLVLVNGQNQLLPSCKDVPPALVWNGTSMVEILPPCRNGEPFLQGLLGLKILMGYIPLIFCAYVLIDDKKKLFSLGRLLAVLAIICCLLALVQFWMLRSGRCYGTRGAVGDLLFKPTLKAKCLVGGALLYTPEQGVIRLPGTFVSPWHWAWFLIANGAISFTVAFSETSLFWRITGLASMTLVFINAVISGQRIALALVPAIIIILLILTGQIANLKRFIPLGIGFTLLLFIGLSIFNPAFIQERIDSFVGRWNQSPPYLFVLDQFGFAWRNLRPFGWGLGVATNSTRAFGDTSLVETFHPKLIQEMGIPGLVAFMILITHLTILTFKAYRSVRTPTLRSYASCFWVFMLIIGYFPYWYPLDTDPVAVYYWFFVGVIFKLPELDKQEQKQLKSDNKNTIPNQKTRRFGKKNLSAA
jgi:hypothetical protein